MKKQTGLAQQLLRAAIVTTCMSFSLGTGSASAEEKQPIPVILDTDIGGDIDDMWALGFLLACPELDVKLIVSDSHDTVQKAKLLTEFLQRAGRDDIPVGIGLNTGEGIDASAKWMREYRGGIRRDGVQALIDTIMKSERRISLLAIGPVPNLRTALQREPRIADHARLVVMGGCIGKQEEGEAGFPEYNVRRDPQAAREAYGAGWDVTMAPVDTAGKAILAGASYQLVRDSENPVAKMLMEHYRAWNQRQTTHARDTNLTSSILWDTVAVYLVFDDSFCKMRDIRLEITDDGITKPTPNGKLTRVAMEWKDLDAFLNLVAERVSGLGRK